jgi:hypothetical protein
MKRRLGTRREQLRAALARGVCSLTGHRYPLQPKYDQGRRPWLCPRCRLIVAWGEHPAQPPRFYTAYRMTMYALICVWTAWGAACVLAFGWHGALFVAFMLAAGCSLHGCARWLSNR